jgi:hypothetical protein
MRASDNGNYDSLLFDIRGMRGNNARATQLPMNNRPLA